jgi:PKD repeat protein
VTNYSSLWRKTKTILKVVIGLTLTLLALPGHISIQLDVPTISSNPDEPPYPTYYETSEYLIGKVAVGIIFVESNGTIDPQTENWTPTEELQVINEITSGLSWLSSQNPSANVNFTFDIHYSVPTSYEPINRPHTQDVLWINDAMTYLGYPGQAPYSQVRDYVNDLRDTFDTDWAYAIFIVDSSNDPDGSFTDGYFAYSYLGKPTVVITYDNNGWGINNMDRVIAHETCHVFYATDEFNGEIEYSGYLNISDNEGSGGLMDTTLAWALSNGTWGQLGWLDTDGDGILDIIDTFPDTKLNPYFPDPTTNTILIYNGSVTVVPYPNKNPHGTGRNVTINTIKNVQFRIDGGPWINATPIDGAFDEPLENFTFTTPPLSAGTHTIETRGINSVGNIEVSYASDTVTVEAGTPHAYFTYSPSKPAVGQTVTFNATLSTPNGGEITNYIWNFGDTTTNTTNPIIAHTYNVPGNYNATLTVLDSEGQNDTVWTTITIHQHNIAVTNITFSKAVVERGFVLDINVTVVNKGNFTETFNITAYADQNATIIGDEVTIGTRNVTLSHENLVIVTFIWDTRGVTLGTYTISAYADPVPYEINLTDNTCVGETVKITVYYLHDVAIISLIASPVRATLGEPISIDVTVENQGNYTEVFRVNLYYTRISDPLIGSKKITLTAGASTTLTLRWTPNMTGRYKIRAEANAVPNEFDIADNTRTVIIHIIQSTEQNTQSHSDESVRDYIVTLILAFLAALTMIPKFRTSWQTQ